MVARYIATGVELLFDVTPVVWADVGYRPEFVQAVVGAIFQVAGDYVVEVLVSSTHVRFRAILPSRKCGGDMDPEELQEQVAEAVRDAYLPLWRAVRAAAKSELGNGKDHGA